MTFLDLRTVLFTEALGSLISLAVVVLLWYQNRNKFKGLNLWAAGYLVQVAGIPLIVARGAIPDFLSFVVSNTLIVSGPLLIYLGLLAFLGVRQRQLHNYWLLIGFVIFESYFSLIRPNLLARDILISAAVLVFSFQAAWLTLVKVPQGMRPMTRWTGLTLGLICLVSIFRIGGFMISQPSSDNFFNASQFDTAMLVGYAVLVIFLTFNLILMINRRLLNAEQRYNDELKLDAALLDQANDAIFLRDKAGHFRYVNKKTNEILGYSRKELSHKTIQEIVVPEYIPQIADRVKDMERTGEAQFESSMYRKDGTSVPLEVHARLIIHRGEELFLAVCRDISGRKRAQQALQDSEAKYRRFFESSLEGVGISRGDRVVDANAALLEIFGYETLDEFKSKALMELVAPESRAFIQEQTRKARQGETQEKRYQYWILRQNGEKRLVEISTAHVNSEGEVLTYATFRDITEKQQYQERIEELYQKEKAARQELEEEAKARGLFINVLAHELRTPLTPMLSSTENLKDMLQSDPPGIQTKLINNIYSSTQIMAQRLEDLLDVARYSRGVFQLNKEVVKLQDFLPHAIERFRPFLEGNQQQLMVEIPPNLPAVELDTSRIEQVLVNLLSNASKYSAKDKNVYLKAGVRNSIFRVDIRDEGNGISADEQSRLFQPYHRVQADLRIPGLGLGLAVCKQIVETHGGRIWVESEVGKGSTFSFEIPV